jgi:hypothetical protein
VSCCEICFQKHGLGCEATHTDADGRAVCVFCLDSVPCPELRRLSKQRDGCSISSKEEKPVNATTSLRQQPTTGNSQIPQPPRVESDIGKTSAQATRSNICEVEGCGTELGRRNKSGFCGRHFHRSERRTASHKPSSGIHASERPRAVTKAPGGTNGQAIGLSSSCKVRGCVATLGPLNKSGFCRRHFRRSKIASTEQIDAIRSSTRAIAGPLPNGQVSEARLNSLILAWPVDQKLKVLNAWLTAAV